MSRDCVIYKILNIKTKQIYIGSSINIKQRINRHFKDLKANKHHSLKMQRSYNKYGKESFNVEYLLTIPEEYRQKIEQWFLDNNECYFNNEKIVGKPSCSRIFSEEQRKFLRDRMIGNELWKLMKPISEDTKLKISKHNKGKVLSEDTKEKMSKSKIGNSGRKGQPHTEYTKNKMSTSSHNKKEVLQFNLKGEFIRSWESATKVAKEFNISSSSIQSCCKKINKTAHGYIWRYTEDTVLETVEPECQ